MADRKPLGARLARELVRVLKPLGAAVEAGEPLEALAQLMADAFVDGDLTFGLTRMQQLEASLRTGWQTVDGLADSDFDVDEWPSALQKIEALVDVVTELSGTPEQPESDLTTSEASLRLLEHLLGLYLTRYRGALYSSLVMLRLLEPPDPEAGRSFVFHVDRLGRWIRDSAEIERDLIGWGTPTFDPDPWVEGAAMFFDAFGLAARVGEDQPGSLEPDLSFPGPRPFTTSAWIRILAAESPVVLRFGARLQALPASSLGNDAGFALAPFGNVTGTKEAPRDEDGHWLTRVALDGRIDGEPFVSLRPRGLDVVEPAGSAFDGTLVAELRRAPGSEAVDAIDADVVQLTLGHPAFVLSLRVGEGEPDLDVALTTEDAAFTVSPPEGDGFLARLLPEPLTQSFAFRAGWNTADGFYFDRGKSLTLSLPLSLDLASVLRLDMAHVAVTVPDGLEIEVLFDGSASLGPLGVTLEGIGLVAGVDLDDRIGGFRPDLSFRPPRGVGLSLELGPVEGGGFVSHTPETGQYVGALELQLRTLGLTAFGIIDTRMPDGSDGFSMLVLVTGRFAPIPIGFGFTLNGVGGLLGLNRDVDVDALFAAIRAGTARDLLAPEDPVRDAPRLARRAGAIFPVARGQHVFGPTLQLGWGSPKQVITLDLGLAVTLPDPLRLILIGTIRAVLPDEKLAIAKINIDIAGVLDLSASRFDLEGRIYDSVIQGLPITGGFAMRSSWGRDRAFAFSIGGLHPGFSPPARFPTLDRMGVDLSRGANFQFRLGGYFAITSNSLQLGARADLKVRQSGFTLLADLGFDALLILDPFGMDLRIYAGATLKRGGTTLCSLRIEARLRGPGPWRVSGSVTVRILLLKVSVGFSKSFGQDRSALTEAVDAAALIAGALATPRSWIVEGASHAGDIVLEGLGEALGPYSPLAVQQKVAPLELRLDQLGGRTLTGPRRFEIRRLELGERELMPVGALTGAFAPAQFTDMTESERLSAPSFEDMIAGSTFAGEEAVEAEGPVVADTSIEMIILDAPPALPLPAFRARREMIVSPRPTEASGTHRPVAPVARISVRTEEWVATDGALGAGQRGTHARLAQEAPGAVLARAGEVVAA